jgi:predicted RNA-binding Zn-ribbon protein involved in translation (DUF1610 family)
VGARFFCENCGAEVKRNAKTCPRCGRSFSNVLCPACGFVGEGSLFSAGCPVCGYTAGSPAVAKPKTSKPKTGFKPEKTPPPKFAAASPPAWAYLLAILALAGVLALLFSK